MYIVVKFGENEEALFNPKCKSITLLDNIKEKCNCNNEDELDLSDENGNVKNLRDNPYRYAHEMLSDRQKFVLLRVEKSDSGDSRFVPLLNDQEALSDAFLKMLASKANVRPGSRSRRGTSTNRNKGSKTPTKSKGEEVKPAKQISVPDRASKSSARSSSTGRSKPKGK